MVESEWFMKDIALLIKKNATIGQKSGNALRLRLLDTNIQTDITSPILRR